MSGQANNKLSKWITALVLVLVLLFMGYVIVPMGFSYKLQDKRNIPAPNKEVRTAVDRELAQQGLHLNEMQPMQIMKFTNDFVADHMEYHLNISDTDPNHVWKTGKGNCASYAALQVSILNYLFEKIDVGHAATWHSGKVYYAGKWLGKGLGYHCYPVVYVDNQFYYPDACFKDLLGDGFLVSSEYVNEYTATDTLIEIIYYIIEALILLVVPALIIYKISKSGVSIKLKLVQSIVIVALYIVFALVVGTLLEKGGILVFNEIELILPILIIVLFPVVLYIFWGKLKKNGADKAVLVVTSIIWTVSYIWIAFIGVASSLQFP